MEINGFCQRTGRERERERETRKTLKPHRSFNLYFLRVPFPFFSLHLYSLPILLPSFIRLSGHKFTASITGDRNNAGFVPPFAHRCLHPTLQVLKNQSFFFSFFPIGENAVKNSVEMGGQGSIRRGRK